METLRRSKRKRAGTNALLNRGNYGSRDCGEDGDSFQAEYHETRGTPPLQDNSCVAHRPVIGARAPTSLGGNLNTLSDFLNSDNIRTELLVLRSSSGLGTLKAYWKPSSTDSMLSNWFMRNNKNNILANYLSVLPNNSLSTGPILLHQAIHSAQGLVNIAGDVAKLNIVTRLLQWDMARSLISIYLWHSKQAPKVANSLVSIHNQHGFEYLRLHSPIFADLVDYLYKFISHQREAAEEDERQQRAKRRKTNHEDQTAEQVAVQGNSPESTSLETLPARFLGLNPESNPILLTKECYEKVYNKPWRGNKAHKDELVFKRTSELLQELWSLELILPPLIGIDSRLNSKKRSASMQPAQILARTLTRGAILFCIAEVCGTDTMFASEKALSFLSSPALVYSDRLKKDKDFARSICRDPISTLQPLQDWLKWHINADTDFIGQSMELGSFIHEEAVKLQFGSTTSSNRSTENRSSRSRKKEFSSTTRQDLLPDLQSPKFGLIGLILREAINERRNLKPGNEVLSRVLTGIHATRSSSIHHNRDQTDPVRQYSKTAELLHKNLTGINLTSRNGLSNLLAWMGTGQGNGTASFLRYIDCQGGFFSKTVEDMVWKFERCLAHNAVLLASEKKTTSPRLIPGYLEVDDMRIWGQPCNLLKATPSVPKTGEEMTLNQKFAPYFSSIVEDEWWRWLGDLAGQDPTAYTGTRKSWKEGLEFILKLKISGFLQGLTLLQTVNNLVFSGILSMPELNDVADWIYDNPKLGAYRGLIRLGFSLKDCGFVRCAFACVYNHLDRYLMAEDKTLLGFNPIFTEHVLCKIVRWDKRLEEEGDPACRLDVLVESIRMSAYVWKGSQNSEGQDKNALPFPLEATSQELDLSIHTVAVSCS